MAEKSMVRAMCAVQLKDRKRSKGLMLGLNETIDQKQVEKEGCEGWLKKERCTLLINMVYWR